VGKLWGILLSISPVHSSIGGGFDLTFGIFAARGLFCLLFELSPASWGRLIHVRSTLSNIRRFLATPHRQRRELVHRPFGCGAATVTERWEPL
jgi:hypothetical protein